MRSLKSSSEKFSSNKLTSNKMSVSGPLSSGGGDAICSVLTLATLAGPPATAGVVYTGNNMLISNPDGLTTNSVVGYDAATTFDLNGSVPVAVEATCLAPSVLDDNGAMAIVVVATDFSTNCGVTATFGTGADGTIEDLNANVILSGLPRPTFPYTLHLEANEDGTGTFEDSEGNTGVIAAIAPFTGKTCVFATGTEPPDTMGATLDVTTNASGPLAIALTDPLAKTYCNLTPSPAAVAQYKFFEQSGDANAVLSNSDRTITVTHDNVLDGDFVEAFAFDSDEQTRGTYSGNVFEFEIDSNTLSALNGFLSLLPVVSPDSARGLVIGQDFTSNFVSLDNWQLFTHDVQAGDSFAAIITQDTANEEVLTRFCFRPSLGNAVFITDWPLRGSDNINPTNLILQNQSVAQAAGVLAGTFNGIDGDLVIPNYPLGSVGYNGIAIPSHTIAETRNVLWQDTLYNNVHEQAGNTISVLTGNDLTIVTSAAAAIKNMRAWKNVMVEDGSGIRATGISITVPFTTGAGEICGAIGFGSDSSFVGGNSRIWICVVAGDLVLYIEARDGTSTQTIIKGGYSSAIGDEWMVEIDTDARLCRAHVDDGVLVTTAWETYVIGAEEPETRWMEVAGCDDLVSTVPDSDGCQLNNIMHTGISAGMIDALAIGSTDFNNANLVSARAWATSGNLTGPTTLSKIDGIDDDEIVLWSGSVSIDEIRTYTETAGNFAETGTAIAAVGQFGGVAYMPNTTFDAAWCDHTNSELKMYRRTAGVWATLGNPFAYTGGEVICAINSTDVVISNNVSLFYYRFDGSDWAQVGSTFSLGLNFITDVSGLACLSVDENGNARFVLVGDDNAFGENRISSFLWDNTAEEITRVGNAGSGPLTMGLSSGCAVAALSSCAIAIFEETSNELTTHTWNPQHTTWSERGTNLVVTAGSSPDMGMLDREAGKIALYSFSNGIRSYDYT